MRRMVCIALVALIGILVLATTVGVRDAAGRPDPGEVTLYPIADSDVNSQSPDSNYGGSSFLHVRFDSYFIFSYIMFDLSSIPLDAVITSAKLQVYCWSISWILPPGAYPQIGVHYCSDTSWAETGITWNNRPSFEPTATSVTIVDDVGYWFSWEVAADVQLALSNRKLTEVLKAENTEGYASLTFYSREWGDEDKMPRLIVRYGTTGFSLLEGYFIKDGCFSVTIVYGETLPHTLWGARTIDVVGGTSIGMAFATWATTVELHNMLDIDVYDGAAEDFRPEGSGPLIAVGGPCVNWGWWHYNHYIPYNPSETSDLWAWFVWVGGTFPTGHPEIWTKTAHNYVEGQANAIVQLYWDTTYNRPVLLVAGISGIGSRGASEWLAGKILDRSILTETCSAFVLKVDYTDYTHVTIVERI